MTAEQLRNSILQEAFSGSLTHDDLSEWEYVTLGDICNFGKCESIDVKDIPNDAWVLELEDIEKDTARILKRLTLRERKIKGTRHKFQKGQLLYSKLRTYLNKVLVAPADGYCTGEIVPITFKEGISVEYMCHFMRSPFVLQYTASCGYGIKMPRVNPKQMNGIEVPLPPLAEQQRIVAKLEELLPIVEQYGKAQTELDELNAALPARLRQSILQQAISGKLVPQDENDEPTSLFLERLQETKEGLVKHKILKKDALSFGVVKEEDIPFEIPATWEWRYLGDLVYLVSGTSYKKDDVRNNGIRILRGGNIVNDKLVLADDDVFLSEEYRSGEKNIRPNDIVIVASTGSKKVIGKPALVKEPIADTQIGAFLRIVRPIDTAYVPYLWTLFRSEYYRGHIRDLVKGTNINNIKEEYLTYMPIPLPPLAEQQRIVAKIEELFEQIDKIKK